MREFKLRFYHWFLCVNWAIRYSAYATLLSWEVFINSIFSILSKCKGCHSLTFEWDILLVIAKVIPSQNLFCCIFCPWDCISSLIFCCCERNLRDLVMGRFHISLRTQSDLSPEKIKNSWLSILSKAKGFTMTHPLWSLVCWTILVPPIIDLKHEHNCRCGQIYTFTEI